jgi:uncharacterized protein (UPF0332 family)
MSFPDDLLEQARHLASRETKRPRQASLRRAISTAYYALFHLLISEATLKWKNVDQRSTFARLFEHGKMRSASHKQRAKLDTFLNTNPLPGPELTSARNLHTVADTFSDAQQQRHTADYDNATTWTRAEVLSQIDLVTTAFQSWHAIRNEPQAHAYLLALLGKPHGN